MSAVRERGEANTEKGSDVRGTLGETVTVL